VEEFIERYYNECRLHSALDYCLPEEFEKESQMDFERASAAAIMTFLGGWCMACSGPRPPSTWVWCASLSQGGAHSAGFL